MWRKVAAYISLMKPFNSSKSTLYYGLCSFIGSLLAGSWSVPVWSSFVVALAVTLSAFAVYALNDITDVKIDAINASSRPLPSGKVSLREAETLTVALFALSFLVASTVNLLSLGFILLFSFLGIVYSVPPVRLKDGVLGGACWGAGIASAMVGGASVVAISESAVVAAFTLAVLTAGCGFTKDLKDLEGDKAQNVRTLPVLLGEKRSIVVMTVMSVVGFGLLFANVLFSAISVSCLLTIVLATCLFGYSLVLLHKCPCSRGVYVKAYKIQAVVGFVIVMSFVISALVK